MHCTNYQEVSPIVQCLLACYIDYFICLATMHAKKELSYDHAVCYGEESGEIVDIYNASPPLHGDRSPPTILVYIHGGSWNAPDLKLVVI